MLGIKFRRELAGLTQSELAASLGVCRTAVTNWETLAVYPRAELLPNIARELGCSIDELYTDTKKDREGGEYEMIKLTGENLVALRSAEPITISRGEDKVVIVGQVSFSYSTGSESACGEFNLPIELLPELHKLNYEANQIIARVGDLF